jgi:hypothetical protein
MRPVARRTARRERRAPGGSGTRGASGARRGWLKEGGKERKERKKRKEKRKEKTKGKGEIGKEGK